MQQKKLLIVKTKFKYNMKLYLNFQVIGAKVVTNARTPGSRCYGYVTMASAQDAENCIKNLHRTGKLYFFTY